MLNPNFLTPQHSKKRFSPIGVSPGGGGYKKKPYYFDDINNSFANVQSIRKQNSKQSSPFYNNNTTTTDNYEIVKRENKNKIMFENITKKIEKIETQIEMLNKNIESEIEIRKKINEENKKLILQMENRIETKIKNEIKSEFEGLKNFITLELKNNNNEKQILIDPIRFVEANNNNKPNDFFHIDVDDDNDQNQISQISIPDSYDGTNNLNNKIIYEKEVNEIRGSLMKTPQKNNKYTSPHNSKIYKKVQFTENIIEKEKKEEKNKGEEDEDEDEDEEIDVGLNFLKQYNLNGDESILTNTTNTSNPNTDLTSNSSLYSIGTKNFFDKYDLN